MKTGVEHRTPYKVVSLIIIAIIAFLFAFPLYWIITGAFKTAADINSVTPVWFPSEFTMKNFETLLPSAAPPCGSWPSPSATGLQAPAICCTSL